MNVQMSVQKLQKKVAKFKRLRWFARSVVVGATASSIWSNWLHSEQNPIAIIINIAPPVLLLAAYEMTSRIPLWGGRFRKWIRPVTMVVITGMNAWLSYWHQHDAFLRFTHDLATAILLPLAIDALMVIASVAVMDLNEMIEQHEAYIEAGGVSTYKAPKEKEKEVVLPPKPKERAPNQKERIIELLANAPNMKIEDIAKEVGAKLNYIYTVRTAWLAAQAEQAETQAMDRELAMA